jgi:hypothetical protein
MKTDVDEFKQQCLMKIVNMNHQVIYIDGVWHHRKPLMNKSLLAIQESIFKRKIEDETLD